MKKRICEVFIVIGLLLVAGFFVAIAYTYFSNTWRAGALPFHTIVLLYGLKLLVPGALITTAAFIIRSKQ